MVDIKDLLRHSGELEEKVKWYKKTLKKIEDIMSWDDKDIEEKYWEIYEYVRTALDGEPTTADEYNEAQIQEGEDLMKEFHSIFGE